MSNYRTADILDETVAHVKSVAARFHDIDIRFAKINNIFLHPEFNPQSEFGKFHKEYIALLWKSREISAKAQASGSDFNGDILDMILDTTVPNDDKVAGLETAIEEWKKSAARAQDQLQTFQHLRDPISGTTLTVEAEQDAARSAEVKLRAEIEEFNSEIRGIRETIPLDVPETGVFISLIGLPFSLVSGIYKGVIDRSLHNVFTSLAIFQRPEYKYLYDPSEKHGTMYSILLLIFLLSNVMIALMLRAIAKCTGIVRATLENILKGSPQLTLDVVFRALQEGKDEINLIKNSLAGTRAPQNDDARAGKARVAEKLEEVLVTIAKSVELLNEIRDLKNEIGQFLDELKAMSVIYEELTSGARGLISKLNDDHSLVAEVAELRRSFFPLIITLDLYARNQLIFLPETPPAYSPQA